LGRSIWQKPGSVPDTARVSDPKNGSAHRSVLFALISSVALVVAFAMVIPILLQLDRVQSREFRRAVQQWIADTVRGEPSLVKGVLVRQDAQAVVVRMERDAWEKLSTSAKVRWMRHTRRTFVQMCRRYGVRTNSLIIHLGGCGPGMDVGDIWEYWRRSKSPIGESRPDESFVGSMDSTQVEVWKTEE
jgi:hypothetical protein